MSAGPPPFADLQSFLRHLESTGRLRRISAAVDKDRELACIARWWTESVPEHDAGALQFDNVRGFDTPVAVNVYWSDQAFGEALGVEAPAILDRWAEALDRPRKPRLVEHAPVHEMVEAGNAVDLGRLPAPVWTPGRDAGPYLSAACVITRDPTSGVQNLAAYRIQIQGPQRLGLFFGSRLQHGARHLAKHRERGEAMPVALVVGAAPAVNFAAAAKTAYGIDELDIAGGLMGTDLEVVRCRTSNLLVPAKAECVIEGVVPLTAEAPEGPFGEALGYMNWAAPSPYIDVTAICRRARAVHHGYIQQLPPTDGHRVFEQGVIGPLWYYLQRKLRVTAVRDIAIARGSSGVSTLVVQFHRGRGGEAASVGRAMARLNFGQKWICLVDDDIDIRDPETLMWAISSRVDPIRDIHTTDKTQTFQLDPAVFARAASAARDTGPPPYELSMGVIDATLKCGVPEISLPTCRHMDDVLNRWSEFGLPAIRPRERIRTLLSTHSDNDHQPGPGGP